MTPAGSLYRFYARGAHRRALKGAIILLYFASGAARSDRRRHARAC